MSFSFGMMREKEEEGGEGEEGKEKPEMVLYTAPTGKAAAVIRRRIKKKAYTIHSVSN